MLLLRDDELALVEGSKLWQCWGGLKGEGCSPAEVCFHFVAEEMVCHEAGCDLPVSRRNHVAFKYSLLF